MDCPFSRCTLSAIRACRLSPLPKLRSNDFESGYRIKRVSGRYLDVILQIAGPLDAAVVQSYRSGPVLVVLVHGLQDNGRQPQAWRWPQGWRQAVHTPEKPPRPSE